MGHMAVLTVRDALGGAVGSAAPESATQVGGPREDEVGHVVQQSEAVPCPRAAAGAMGASSLGTGER